MKRIWNEHVSLEELKKLRKKHKITQQKLADMVGYHVGSIRNIECGNRPLNKQLFDHMVKLVEMTLKNVSEVTHGKSSEKASESKRVSNKKPVRNRGNKTKNKKISRESGVSS